MPCCETKFKGPFCLFFTLHSFPFPCIPAQCSPSSSFPACGASGTSPRPPTEIFTSLKHDLGLDLMQVLSTEQSSSPFKSYFRGLSGHEIACNFNTYPLCRINLMLIVVKLLWRIVFLAMSDVVCLFLCNNSYVTSLFIQSTWNCLD